jgi:hypothetical protein
MKREAEAKVGGEQGRAEQCADNNRSTVDRGDENEVRPELGVLGWAARAQRLFGAMTLHA